MTIKFKVVVFVIGFFLGIILDFLIKSLFF